MINILCRVGPNILHHLSQMSLKLCAWLNTVFINIVDGAFGAALWIPNANGPWADKVWYVQILKYL